MAQMLEIAFTEERIHQPTQTIDYPINYHQIERREVPRPIQTREAIHLIMTGWKILVGAPTQGQGSTAWDQVHGPENMGYAYKMLLLFGNWEEAVRAMEYVFRWHRQRGLFVTLKSIVRNSDLFREQMREV